MHMKKWLMTALVIAGIGAFAVGVRGGWTVAQDYFALKEVRAASR